MDLSEKPTYLQVNLKKSVAAFGIGGVDVDLLKGQPDALEMLSVFESVNKVFANNARGVQQGPVGRVHRPTRLLSRQDLLVTLCVYSEQVADDDSAYVTILYNVSGR